MLGQPSLFDLAILEDSDPERAAKGAAAIKTGCGVVVDEDVIEATIGKDGAAEFRDVGGSFNEL